MICEKCEYPLLTQVEFDNAHCPQCMLIAKLKMEKEKEKENKIDDGGPAEKGLCVRDYMATAAMRELIAHDHRLSNTRLTEYSYQLADKMIARSKEKPIPRTKDQIIDDVAREWGLSREEIDEILEKPPKPHMQDLPKLSRKLDAVYEAKGETITINLYDFKDHVAKTLQLPKFLQSEMPEIILWRDRVFYRSKMKYYFVECTHVKIVADKIVDSSDDIEPDDTIDLIILRSVAGNVMHRVNWNKPASDLPRFIMWHSNLYQRYAMTNKYDYQDLLKEGKQ